MSPHQSNHWHCNYANKHKAGFLEGCISEKQKGNYKTLMRRPRHYFPHVVVRRLYLLPTRSGTTAQLLWVLYPTRIQIFSCLLPTRSGITAQPLWVLQSTIISIFSRFADQDNCPTTPGPVSNKNLDFLMPAAYTVWDK